MWTADPVLGLDLGPFVEASACGVKTLGGAVCHAML